MNYCIDDLPESYNTVVFFEISLKEECIGKILIRLYRDVFPAGVENFIGIARGKTYRTEKKGFGRYQYKKEIRRTYEGCKFFSFLYNNYTISGDIYKNNGTDAGTIYCDKPISDCYLGDYYFPHDRKGLISLVPFIDERTGRAMYDSTFLITLDDIKPSNNLAELNCNHVVIGQIYSGMEVIDKMNKMYFGFAGRKYPEFVISKCGVYGATNNMKMRAKPLLENVRYILPQCNQHCGEPICSDSDDDGSN